MSSQLSNEMSLLFEMMKVEMQKQTLQITENVTATILKTVDEKMKPLIEENELLKYEVLELNRKVEFLDSAARKNNIIIHGLPEVINEKDEDLINIALETIKKLDVPLARGEIDRIQRLGKNTNKEKIRPILLTTTTLQKKIQILRNKKKMEPKTYITHDFSKKEMEKRKEIAKNFRESEKRKRIETPSPEASTSTNTKNEIQDPKIQKTNAFQLMRERSYALSDKNTYRY